MGKGVNCEKEMREKNEMVRGDVCVWWGRRKKKGKGVHGWWEKKKKEIKRKKEMGSGIYVFGGRKKGEWKRKKKKF